MGCTAHIYRNCASIKIYKAFLCKKICKQRQQKNEENIVWNACVKKQDWTWKWRYRRYYDKGNSWCWWLCRRYEKVHNRGVWYRSCYGCICRNAACIWCKTGNYCNDISTYILCTCRKDESYRTENRCRI